MENSETHLEADVSSKFSRFRLDIAYDGTDFSGWATQPGLRTVQGTLEKALELVLPRVQGLDYQPRLTVAGRTDAGVHALGQVAHLDIPEEIVNRGFSNFTGNFSAGLLRKVSRAISKESDVVIKNVSLAPAGFDARFSALSRSYEYKISDASSPVNPLNRRDRWVIDGSLDLDVLNQAAKTLLGLRDFGSFCKPREGSTTIRELQEFSWRRDETGTLIAFLKADAFCHSMVRNLVGGLVEVAKGRLNLVRLSELAESVTRSPEIKVAPALGLTLVAVGYPENDQLALRAEKTRGLREL